MKYSLINWVVVIFAVLVASCSSDNRKENHLGEIQMEVSGSAEARPYFEQGLLLLHSFQYPDAAEAFVKAQEIDPDFAMAYWGEAMTFNHTLWRFQDPARGKAALEKLGTTEEKRKVKAATPQEQDFLQAAEILYGKGTKTERNEGYADFMEKMYRKYPKSHEAAAFYALSLLGSVPVGRNDEVYEKAAVVAKGIMAENPNHPGALHYLIHSYDDPMHASLALHAADSYAKVAPNAGHALHMPSHIYVAMGMWDEVVISNEVSWQASVDRMKRKKLSLDAQNYHAFHWLLYGYLQQGRYAKARQMMDDMVQYVDSVPSKNARAYLISMKGTYLVETNDWSNQVAAIEADTDNLNISLQAINFYLQGIKAYQQGDKTVLKEVMDTMQKERIAKAAMVNEKGISMCSGTASLAEMPNKLDIDQAHVMELQLHSLLAGLEGNEKEEEQYLKKAAILEESISYSYGPPPIVKPSHELYGEWLLQTNHPEEAQVQFEKALERGPKRVLSLSGQRQAATLLNDTAKAQEANDLLQKIQQQADEEVRAQMKELQSALL